MGRAVRIFIRAFALAATAASAMQRRALITAQDRRGNRIEPFDQTHYSILTTAAGRAVRNRNRTDDRSWCAAARLSRPFVAMSLPGVNTGGCEMDAAGG